MKTQTLCLCLAALALAISACNKPDPENTKTPIFSVSETSLSAAIEGGTYSFTYTVTDPADDGAVTCYATVDWITDFNLSVSGTVSFTVEANNGSASRIGTIAAVYSYSGKDIEKDIIVSQAADPTRNVTAVCAQGVYGGDVYESDYYEYMVYLSDSETTKNMFFEEFPIKANIYILAFWSSTKPDDLSDIKLPAGTYIYGEEEENNVFSDETEWLYIYDEDWDELDESFIEEGTIVVSYEDGVYTIEAKMTDEDNVPHNVTYTGAITFKDYSRYF